MTATNRTSPTKAELKIMLETGASREKAAEWAAMDEKRQKKTEFILGWATILGLVFATFFRKFGLYAVIGAAVAAAFGVSSWTIPVALFLVWVAAAVVTHLTRNLRRELIVTIQKSAAEKKANAKTDAK